jgi:hypothetical protein
MATFVVRHTNPKRTLAAVLTLLVAIVATVTLALCGGILADHYARSLLANQIQSSLDATTAKRGLPDNNISENQAALLIERLHRLEPPLGMHVLFSLQGRSVLREHETGIQLLQSLSKIYDLIRAHKFEAARTDFEALKDRHQTLLLAQTGASQASAKSLVAFATELTEAEDLASLTKKEAPRIAELRASRETIHARRKLLAQDFGELLSLTPTAFSAEDDMPRYERGILAGAPTLETLPDDLPTLEVVKSQLDLLGGGVQLTEANAFTAFQFRLDAIRTESESLTTEYEQLKTRLEFQKALVEESHTKLVALTTKLARRMRVLIHLVIMEQTKQAKINL